MGGFDAAYLASPADASKVKYGASEIRAAKLNDQEVLAIDHYVTTGANLTKHGQHKKITFNDVLGIGPSLTGNEAAIYTKDLGGIPAPYFKEGSDEYKIVLGDSNMIAWFYTNVAPIGWTVSADGADRVLGVAGGSGEYNVNGGNLGGSVTTQYHLHTTNNHTHTINNHVHHSGGLQFSVFWKDADGTLKGYNLANSERRVATASAVNTYATPTQSLLIPSASGGKIDFGTFDGTGATTYQNNSGMSNSSINTNYANSSANSRVAAAVGRLYSLDI